jgi:hypothetical protein
MGVELSVSRASGRTGQSKVSGRPDVFLLHGSLGNADATPDQEVVE